MALVFGDSFDHYAVADILKKWTAIESGITDYAIAAEYALPPHRTGLRIVSGKYLSKTLPAALTTFICGAWFRPAAVNSRIICAFMDSATATNIHVSVRLDSTGHITLCRDATVLATSTNTMTAATWYHLEIKAIIDNSVGQYEVKVDGTSVNWIPQSTADKDTQNSGNASIGSLRIYGDTDYWQDLYILNTTGAVASNFLGPCRFQVMRPVGVGTTAEWTGNYADNWQNVVTGDSDNTFNQSVTAGQTDQFAMTDVPTGTIHAIQHVLMARKDAGAARVVRPITRIGGSDYNGTSFNLAASYVFYCDPVSVSPATGGSTAWDDAELCALEGGYELVS